MTDLTPERQEELSAASKSPTQAIYEGLVLLNRIALALEGIEEIEGAR